MKKKQKLVRHETLIPENLKKWIKSLKSKGYGSESTITSQAIMLLKDTVGNR